jgi:hypothetical protein
MRSEHGIRSDERFNGGITNAKVSLYAQASHDEWDI